MAADSDTRHTPGALKQQNKAHKSGRHRSKGQLRKESKGRVNVKSLTKRAGSSLKKQERRNQAIQIRKQKREELLTKKRSKGGENSLPFLVAVIPLCEGIDVESALGLIKTSDEAAVVNVSDSGITHLGVPRFKQRFSFLTPEYGCLYSMLDAAKVADSLLFLVSPERGIDSYGLHCLSSLFAQGLPAVIIATPGMKALSTKKQGESRKMIQKQLDKWFPEQKLQSLDSSQDALLLLRTACSQRLRELAVRENRPHLVAERVAFEMTSPEDTQGTLKVSGYLRGRSLSVNGLIHLPGWGDFQMTQIDAPTDPFPLNRKESRKQKGEKGQGDVMDAEEADEPAEHIRVLERADPARQESLLCEAEADPMEGEQTWPTEEELAEAEAACRKKQKTVRRVPKGTSEYQAAWIVDSGDEEDAEDEEDEDEEEDEDGGSDEDEDDDMRAVTMETNSGEDSEASDRDDVEDEQLETLTLDGDGDEAKYDAGINMDEEEQMLEKIKAARQEQMFPDEVDTPMDTPARVRFQKYRGLKSFRTSPWDPKENLPLDYSRIFQFENFRRTKKRVLASENDNGAMPGWFVTVHIANVPKEVIESWRPGRPLVAFGLLPHEHKMSVLNFVLKRHVNSSQPIKSKERLVFHVGYRRFTAAPIFSEHTNSDKHKFERFFKTDVAMVATVYAPILFPPSSVIVFRENGQGGHDLVATGSLHSVNPDRVVVKRIVLSGHPLKILKRLVVVRYMFFTRDDIMWFKPVELRTKWGRRGHIKEPLGTHGHMKCYFDSQLKSQDSVMMNLYKRMYPRWTYDARVQPPALSTEAPPAPQHIDPDLFD